MSVSFETRPSLQKLREMFSKVRWSRVVASSTERAMKGAVDEVRDEQRKLVPVWEGHTKRATKSKVERSGDEVIGRAGPGVGGEKGVRTLTLEGGRRAGAAMPPYGMGTGLQRWLASKQIPLAAARPIALAIARRGLPTPNNPRTPNPPPVFVERGWNNREASVRRRFDKIGAEIVREGLDG